MKQSPNALAALAHTEGDRMRFNSRRSSAWLALAIALSLVMLSGPAHAGTAAEINAKVSAALKQLYASNAGAKALGQKAKGVLVFPNIVKGGFIIGGSYGQGALRKKGKTTGYYNTVAASFGFQAGAQKIGYAMFFMTNSALAYLEKSDGWEIGVGPSVTILDEGAAAALTTSTAQSDIYAISFDQTGLMAGLSLEGSKITRIHPK
jgi:lipid-binding SYLF domain-containing protein